MIRGGTPPVVAGRLGRSARAGASSWPTPPRPSGQVVPVGTREEAEGVRMAR